jgi:hypothetical protein
MMPAIGVRPPVLTLVVVRAMAPVAAKPPNSGAAMLARPWATSSWLGSWRSSIWLSATRAESSDSMAPSRAMVIAGEISLPKSCTDRLGRPKLGSSCGMPLKRLPMVSTGSSKTKATRVPAISTTSGPGARRSRAKALRQPVVGEQEDEAGGGQRQGRQVDGVGVGGQRLDAGEELGRQVVDLQAEEILDLGEEDDDGDAVGEADDDGDRDETDQLPHAGEAHGEQEDAGEDGRPHQVGEAVHGDDAIDDGDEGARRAADLHPRAAKGGGDEAGDDGGPDAGRRRGAGGDGEGHGQRQGEDADGDPRREILAELRAVVGGQAIQQLGVEGDLHGALGE